MKSIRHYIIVFLAIILISCNDDEDTNPDTSNTVNENNSTETGCKYSDGSHSATVEYNNPRTGHIATYTLNVEVQNCEVIEIDFPKGGWLDDSHIDATEVSSDGDASIEDDKGRTFNVHIDE